MIDGYKKIDVWVKDDDYAILLAAQKACRDALDNPCSTTRAEASRLFRDVGYFAGSVLCSAAEQHSKGEAH